MIWARPEMDGGAVSCQARNPLTRVESPIAQVPLNVRFLHEKEKEQKSALSFKLVCGLYLFVSVATNIGEGSIS